MNDTLTKINRLNERLILSLDKITDMFLAHGKTGICIYLFHLGRLYKNDEYTKLAEGLLDDIIKNLNINLPIDIISGLGGIGLGIHHLIKEGFVQGNENKLLEDIDNAIYKQLSFLNYSDNYTLKVKIQLLFYFYIRLKKQRKNSESEYLYREIIIQTLNDIYKNIDSDFFFEPLFFNIEYTLPQFLYITGKICSLNFYNDRIIKMIEEINTKLLTIFPLLHSNRLYLLWGLSSLNQEIGLKDIDAHINLLKQHLDFNIILNDELQNKSIYFYDGVTSIWLLLKQLKKYFKTEELSALKNQVLQKIDSSEEWNLLINDPDYFNSHMGLLNGYCGLALNYYTLVSNDF